MFRLSQPKQFDREHILLFFHRKLRVFSGFFWIFFFFFGLFRNSLFRLFRFYTETECFDVLIEPKQTEDPPKQFKREYNWVFFRKFRVVSVCFGLVRNSFVCFGCFNIGSKHRKKRNFLFLVSRNKRKTDLVSVRTEIYFCSFRGHPSQNSLEPKPRLIEN
jgi:hypothetical protein